jgi:DnaK suppressor protein
MMPAFFPVGTSLGVKDGLNMTTTSCNVSTRAGHAPQPALSPLQTDALRMALLVGREERTAEFTHHSGRLERLTTHSSDHTTERARALAALHMYVAREAIEEIEDALLRIREGDYGACESCGEWISFARLEASPGARCCSGCSGGSNEVKRS